MISIPELLHRYDRKTWMNHPGDAQENVLERIVRKNENTLFGREYLFREVRDAQDFMRCVPLSMYSDLQPYLQIMMEGGENTLVAEPFIAWMKTVGESGKAKLFPCTSDVATCFQEAFLRVFTAAAADGIFCEEGKVIAGLEGLYTDVLGGKPVGCTSSLEYYALKKIPVVGNMITPSLDTADVANWEIRWMETAARALKHNVIAAVADPVLFLVFLRKMMTEYKGVLDIPDIQEMWPHFSLVISGTNGDPYRHAFRSILGDVEFREVYCVDDMVVGVQMDEKGFVPLYDHYFLEFISLEEWKDMQGRGETYRAYEFDPKTVKTARPGKEYVLAVTTPGGLYRYVTGDVVTLTDGLHMVKTGHIEQQEMGAASIAAQHMVLLREVARDELELNLGIQNQVVAVESEALNYLFGIR